MKTIQIGKLQFNLDACKKMTKKEFFKIHSSICEKHNIDCEYAYEKVSGKKTTSNKD